MKDQFFGDKKIVDVKDGPVADLKQLVFDDGTSEFVHLEVLAASVTEKPVDATQERFQRNQPIIKAVLSTLLKYNIHIEDIDYVCQRVVLSVNESITKAHEVLWKLTNSQKTMTDLNNVLLTKQESDKGIASPFVPEK